LRLYADERQKEWVGAALFLWGSTTISSLVGNRETFIKLDWELWTATLPTARRISER